MATWTRREKLIAELQRCIELDKIDPEAAHSAADKALLAYIANPDVDELYGQITHWCA